MVWYGLVWYGLVWFGMVWHGLAWFGRSSEAEFKTINESPKVGIELLGQLKMVKPLT